MEKVYTKNAPDAIGPYSQAVKVNGLVFTSGQIAINPATGNVEAATIEAQTEQVCTNLKNVLETSGSSLEKAVKTVCFLKNMEDFGAFNEVYGKYFQMDLRDLHEGHYIIWVNTPGKRPVAKKLVIGRV